MVIKRKRWKSKRCSEDKFLTLVSYSSMNLSTFSWKYWALLAESNCRSIAALSQILTVTKEEERRNSYHPPSPCVAPEMPSPVEGGSTNNSKRSNHNLTSTSTINLLFFFFSSVLNILPFLLRSSLQEYPDLAACKRYKAVIERLKKAVQWSGRKHLS